MVTSKNRVSSLDLDLDLDVDGLVRGKLSRHNIYQIALYLCMSTSNRVQVEVQVQDGGLRSFAIVN
jgi:hypothetical protein